MNHTSPQNIVQIAKWLCIFSIFAGIFVTLSSVQSASAQTSTILLDFEDGQLPSANGWTYGSDCVPGFPTGLFLTEGQAYSIANGLLTVDTVGRGTVATSAYYSRNAVIDLNEPLIFEARVQVLASDPPPPSAYSQAFAMAVQVGGYLYLLQVRDDGVVGPDYFESPVLFNTSLSHVYTMLFTPGDSTFKILVDGIDTLTATAVPSGVSNLLWFGDGTCQARNGIATIDYVRFGPVPEPNQSPAADAGGSYDGTEGTSITLDDAIAADPDNDVLSYAWSVDDPSLCTFSDFTLLHPTINCTDNGTFIATLAVNDGIETVTSHASVLVANVDPTVDPIEELTSTPIPVGTSINAVANFHDPGTADTHTCSINWGDSPVAINGAVSMYQCTATHTYVTPGVYIVKMTVTDDDGGADEAAFQYVVVFDSNGGFVTGGGWFGTELSRANFGMELKYKEGAAVPLGNLNFKSGTLRLRSQSLAWLVIVGDKAIFQGTGTLGDNGNYGFIVTMQDLGEPGRNADTFRIRIWDHENGNAIIYDTEPALAIDATPTMTIDGGNIAFHGANTAATTAISVVVIGNPPPALLETLGIQIDSPHNTTTFLPSLDR